MKEEFNLSIMLSLFREQVRNYFDFLVHDFYFEVAKSPLGEEYHTSTEVVYKNKTTAIQINIDYRENYIGIEFIRIAEGKIPKYPIFFKANKELNWANLDEIIEIRAPHLEVKYDSFFWDNEKDLKEIKRVINEYADITKKYCTDILKGDFSIFPEVKKIVARKFKKIK